MRVVCFAMLLTLAGRAGQGQVLPVRAPDGVLRGTVLDDLTGLPIGYALLTLDQPGRRTFANEAGRFALSGVVSGKAILRVQQIGYGAVTLTLQLDATPGTPSAATPLVVKLTRHVVVLPEILVEGDRCSGARRSGEATEGILGEVFQNAERLLALQQDYPFVETYQETLASFDSVGTLVAGQIDTGRYDSRRILRYRRGAVIQREGLARTESALYFQPSDLASSEFRRTHCFWYAGVDSVHGEPAYRIDFAPFRNVRSIDWAGSLLIDSSSMVLVRSDAHLVNLPRQGSSFLWAGCTLLYHQVYPTLVTPNQARCTSRIRGNPPTTSETRWLLINFRFLGRTPAGSESGRP